MIDNVFNLVNTVELYILYRSFITKRTIKYLGWRKASIYYCSTTRVIGF